MISDEQMAIYCAMGGGWPSWFSWPGKPLTKQRHRKGKGGRMYAPDAAEEKATGLILKRNVPEPYRGAVCLVVAFYLPDRTIKDFDNLIKHVADAGNGILWLDDSQVTRATQIVELDRDNPRTVVMIGPHTSTLRFEKVSRGGLARR